MFEKLIEQFKAFFHDNPLANAMPKPVPIENVTTGKPVAKEKIVVGGFIPPVKGAYYNSGNFSPNVATDKNHANGHQGIDVRAEKGAIAQSMSDGIITQVATTPKGGKNLYIKFDNGYKAYYAHLDSITVKQGQKVKSGEQVGTVGNTGNAAGGVPHIHLQIWSKSGNLIDPSTLFSFPKYTAYTKEERVRDKAKKAISLHKKNELNRS